MHEECKTRLRFFFSFSCQITHFFNLFLMMEAKKKIKTKQNQIKIQIHKI